MFHDFCSIPLGRDAAKIMKRPSGKNWVLRCFAQMELTYFFPIPTKNRCGIFGSGTPERKYRNILFARFPCFCSNSSPD